MGTAHKRRKTCAVGAAVLTALLSATACESDGTNNSKGAPPAAPSAPGSSRPGGGGAATGGSSQDAGGSPDASGTSGNTGNGATVAACSDANVSIATTVYPHDSVQHLLLTATNTGDKECALHAYPVVRFDKGREDQVGPMESEMKGASLSPGEKAYAGMLLFRAGAPTDAVTTMTVSLQGRVSNSDPDSRPIGVRLPADTPFLNIDDNPLVSYWNSGRDKAEDYMFKAAGGN